LLAELKAYLHANVNADEIDRSGEIPQKNIDDLFAMGAFAIKVPKQYGGLGYRR
jgi:alkylation response protein AidB-like acyl-CoA dehydrogenase